MTKPLLILDIDETLIHATDKQLDRTEDCNSLFRYDLNII